MAAHRQAEAIDIDLGWNDRPMPAHEEPVVRREDRLIEYIERRFEQRRPSALQDERPLLGKGGRYRPLLRPFRQGRLNHRVGHRWRSSGREGSRPGPPTDFSTG